MVGFSLTFENGQPVMGYDRADTIIQNIWLSIFVKQGSCWAAPFLGSRLYKIKKLTPTSDIEGRAYIDEALKWILSSGRARDLNVTCEINAGENRLDILVTGHKGNNDNIKFDTFYKVV